MNTFFYITLATTLLFLFACSDESNTKKTESVKNDLVAQGEQIFNRKHLGKNKVIGCVLCHSVEQGNLIVGPSLAGLSKRAGFLVENEDARQYIKNAIINPDAYIVEDFLPGTMLANFESALTQNEMDALIAYLMQL